MVIRALSRAFMKIKEENKRRGECAVSTYDITSCQQNIEHNKSNIFQTSTILIHGLMDLSLRSVITLVKFPPRIIELLGTTLQTIP